tara:strand:+ start:175 stop:396 length:222 start_codon:yes stop_codon:yes gene_type:complete
MRWEGGPTVTERNVCRKTSHGTPIEGTCDDGKTTEWELGGKKEEAAFKCDLMEGKEMNCNSLLPHAIKVMSAW